MKRKDVDNKTLKIWKLKSFDTTQDEIHAKTGISKPTIRLAINNGLASQATIEKLTQFFNNLQTE